MFKKFAEAAVLSAELGGRRVIRRQAHRAHFDYTPREGYLYVRSRAISSRCNDNFDEFPAEEIKLAYKTFIGKPVFVNHNNDDHRRARGVVIDAALHEDRNPDGSPDSWCEVLMEVHAARFPKLTAAILAGHVDRTSMGTDVAYSLCSICSNKATTPAEYCSHIPRMKGQRVYKTDKLGKRVGVLVREKCFGLRFFENSLLVEEPADPTAFFTGVDDRGLKSSASRSQAMPQHASPHLAAPSRTSPGSGDRTKTGPTPKRVDARTRRQELEKAASLRAVVTESKTALIGPGASPSFADTGEVDPRKKSRCQTCGGGIFMIMNAANPNAPWLHTDPNGAGMPHQAAPADSGTDPTTGTPAPTSTADSGGLDLTSIFKGAPFAGYDDFADCAQENSDKDDPDAYCGEIKHRTEDKKEGAFSPQVQHDEEGRTRNVDLDDPRSMANHLMAAHGWDKQDFHQFEQDAHPALGKHDGTSRPYTVAEVQAIHDFEHTPDGGGQDFPDAQTAGSMHFHGMAQSLQAEAKPKYEDASQHPGFKNLNLHPGHIVAHWDMASDEEKGQGQNWYEDAHHIAKALAGGNAHKGAGVLAAYSPQTAWPTNMFNASRSLREGKAVGGKGSGVMATGAMRDSAQRVMNGEDYNNVFKGHKITHFAHLIEHGGNKDDSKPHVVMDRHSLSVAAGRRLGDDELGPAQNAMGGEHYYNHVANVYHAAAKHINEKEGRVGKDKVQPHHVQAATWLVRQRLNQQQDHESGTAMGKGRVSGFEKAQTKWMDHAREHYNINEQNMHMKEVRPNQGTTPESKPSTNLNDDPEALERWHPKNIKVNPDQRPTNEQPGVRDVVKKLRPGLSDDEITHHLQNIETERQQKGFISPPKSSKLAYGETIAPMDVDTLRDEECPVCGSQDYSGDQCQECGFVAPPKFLQDPDLDMAKRMDLRKDVAQGAGEMPGAVDGGTEPTVPAADASGAIVDGSGQVPADPAMVDEDGNVNGEVNPDVVDAGQVDADGNPLDPDALDEEGNPIDPGAAGGHVNQGGEPFTEGPNAPMDPADPEQAEDMDVPGAGVGDEDTSGVVPVDVQTLGDEPAPEDPAAMESPTGLVCPACGYSAEAAQPTSTDMDDPMSPDATGGGELEGDACPNCGQAQLESVSDLQQEGVPVGR